MERQKHATKQSPGGNSSISLSWETNTPQPPRPAEDSKSSEFHSRLDQILKGEEKRKILTKKHVKTSVKVNKPPGDQIRKKTSEDFEELSLSEVNIAQIMFYDRNLRMWEGLLKIEFKFNKCKSNLASRLMRRYSELAEELPESRITKNSESSISSALCDIDMSRNDALEWDEFTN